MGSDHVRTGKDEMTGAQKRGWFCLVSHRTRTQASFFLATWCISKRMSTDLPCVNCRQIGYIVESLCVVYLNPLAWTWSFVQRSLMLQDQDFIWTQGMLLLQISFSSIPFLLQRMCSLVMVVVLGPPPMEAALQIAVRKLLREGTGKPCYVFAVVGRTCGYNLFNRVL